MMPLGAHSLSLHGVSLYEYVLKGWTNVGTAAEFVIKEETGNWVEFHIMSFAFENEHRGIFHAEKSSIVR